MTTTDNWPLRDSHEVCDASLSPFTVTSDRGFLPRLEPPATLPSDFSVLDSILIRMPLVREDGKPGLLSTGDLGKTVLDELPDLTAAVEKYKDDSVVIGALYRDYSFIASAYLLEPCHHRHVKGEGYGLGRQTLPSVIARPLAAAAEIAGFAPFMEYAGSYALYNYKLADPARGLEYDNLRLVRAFELGVSDPSSSEAGFIFIHIAMVAHSGQLVSGTLEALEGCKSGDRDAFENGLADVVAAMKKINTVMDRMWSKSKPKDYTSFRTFIFGIKSQQMFPDGVLYEGVSETRQHYRGESGANDSIIPLCDNLLQISMPETPLTEILRDFRSYRPAGHHRFLEWVKTRADDAGVKAFAMQQASSAAMYLRVLDQVREFRYRHWTFAREYILKQTRYPVATGGSPIVTWLPNQLQAVLKSMLEIGNAFPSEQADKPTSLRGCEDMLEVASGQLSSLRKEVEKYCKERNVLV